MGSFRSQPDLVKYSHEKKGPGLSYAVTHMCGNASPTKAGESTWRMLTFRSHLSPTKRILSLESSMATEVTIFLLRSRSLYFCRTPFHRRIREERKLSEERL